jgi:hypothetical protein
VCPHPLVFAKAQVMVYNGVASPRELVKNHEHRYAVQRFCTTAAAVCF